MLYRIRARSGNVDLDDERDDNCWYTPDGAVEEMHFESLETAVQRTVVSHQAEADTG